MLSLDPEVATAAWRVRCVEALGQKFLRPLLSSGSYDASPLRSMNYRGVRQAGPSSASTWSPPWSALLGSLWTAPGRPAEGEVGDGLLYHTRDSAYAESALSAGSGPGDPLRLRPLGRIAVGVRRSVNRSREPVS